MPKQREGIATLSELVRLFHQQSGFSQVVEALTSGENASVEGTWASSCALAGAAIATSYPTGSPVLIVLPTIQQVDDFALDLANFRDLDPVIFPAWESLPQEHNVSDVVFGARLRVLRSLESAEPPSVVITSLMALLQPVPAKSDRNAGTRNLNVGQELDPQELLDWLIGRGFERMPALEAPGEFSMHGGIVDLFPPDALDPIRIEFFGDEIESLRTFDAETQRKIDDLSQVTLTLLTPSEGQGKTARESFFSALPQQSWLGLVELSEMMEAGRSYLDRLGNPTSLFTVQEVMAAGAAFPTVMLSSFGSGGDTGEATCRLQMESIERFTGPRHEVLHELAGVVSGEERVLLSCHNEAEKTRLAELLSETDVKIGEDVTLCVGRVHRGFRWVSERLVVLSDHELFGRTELGRSDIARTRRKKKNLETRVIDSFLELRENDLVVHLTNGIGRYRGMKKLEADEQMQEHLAIEFYGGVMVYVPVSLIHLVQKYVGAAKGSPTLSKLNTKSWLNKKQRVARSVLDMASDMIRLQAARDAKPGLACPPDSHWQHEFDAAFPYTPTVDQDEAILSVKHDLQQSRPMDRLICGDVGFGKTEVAMRSAFKVVDAGRQVAVLVPTTVLAEQHFRTFSERMAEFPITIEGLSRFKTKRQQKQTLEHMASGGVDIVIGTHRLVQKDIVFKDLGLLIIDEEQRFGVEAKEMLKEMRLEVDVLTLSATPIPRTLHMSILGVRDISNLTTAPQERVPIETQITQFDESLIRNGIIRELNRNGQVYFVHNRVYNIEHMADRIRKIVPEASVDIVHGQMPEQQMERAMFNFVAGETDVLVATTIIESGLDIPNANTIFIHQADKYGLADLHQLRGRVGRYKNRAYCYLVLEEGRVVTSDASKRLKAIEEFSELGAGFRISMRDLEIRGAGNILGTEQSGHIASVGYELYCQLLENAVRTLRKEPLREHRHVEVDLPINAFFPESFIPPGRHKIEAYRKLSNIRDFDDLTEFTEELRDRFGPLPEEVTRLCRLKALQLQAIAWSIDHIRLEDSDALFRYRNAKKIHELRHHIGSDLRIVDHESAYLILPRKDLIGDALLTHLLAMLHGSPA